MAETITKRLHISGLTPSLTPEDLSKRFSSFGTVKALDGFGLNDGVDQPRKFGYITVEATPAQLSKCLNSLSGSTWKGAKLRIGDAKPDYTERLAKEKAAEAELPPPKKRQRFSKYTAIPAENMDVVTVENVADHPGWTVTSTGRLLRPMKMRPERPLPPTVDDIKAKNKEGKKKRKVKSPDVRARKKVIDVTRWGGQRLKGVFLENLEIASSTAVKDPIVMDESEEDSDEDTLSNSHLEPVSPPPPRAPSPPSMPIPPPSMPVSAPKATSPAPTSVDLAQEKLQTLNFLESLFGGEKEWVGEESISDVEDAQVPNVAAGDYEMDYEVVPKDDEDIEMQNQDDSSSEKESSPEPTPAPVAPPSTQTKLKDLFAPRAEEAGFSLLGHLDLDDEFDDDVPFSVEPIAEYIPPAPSMPSETYTTTTRPSGSGPARYVFDPTAPFFFPRAGALSKPHTFHRTETDEEIRQNWENTKGELTRRWKKRFREASKVKRRRGGNDDE